MTEEKKISDFRTNVNFAVLFYFGDNDFSSYIEEAVKLFCEQFNYKLAWIDQYEKYGYSYVKSYIDEFEEICKIESVKEIMKCGFLSERMRHYGKVICGIPNAKLSLEKVKSDLDYMQWDGQFNKWKKVGDEYVASESYDRFITGTLEEISNILNKCGDSYENQSENEKFPVWCNGEVVILYMEDGYLTYVVR